MRRKTNRVFRYLFPMAVACMAGFLFIDWASKDAAPQVPIVQPESAVSHDKSQAKMLKLVSHNPQTQARLLVNAYEAIQHEDKMTLYDPIGNFDQLEKGTMSLRSKQASYYQSDQEVHFFEMVKFNHFSGLIATTNYAILNTKTHDIAGNKGIQAFHDNNTITANAFEIETGKNVLHFNGGVCLKVARKAS